jgi:hypothetical protein
MNYTYCIGPVKLRFKPVDSIAICLILQRTQIRILWHKKAYTKERMIIDGGD